MASIPGARFDLTGASGSQGFLGPKASWRGYVFPRGGYASQDSTGTLITFDSAATASRFSANDWLQVGLSTDNIRQVSAVAGNSVAVSGAAVTVSENNRIFVVGQTQPTVTGGSATYTTPNTLIRQRADDTATLYSNSMITSDSNGLIQFFGTPALYDVMIQDGDQSNQGFIAELELGTVQGISLNEAITFGHTVTVTGTIIGTAGVSFNGVAVFGSTVTMNANLGVTGSVVMDNTLDVGLSILAGTTLTANGAFGVTGTAIIGATLTGNGALGITGWATLGSTVTVTGALGVTGTGDFGDDITAAGGFRQSLDGWGDPNAAASQTEALLNRYGLATQSVHTFLRAGSMTGIWIYSNEARTAGTLTVMAVLAGVTQTLVATLDGTNTLVDTTTQAKDDLTFTAGQTMTIAITTDASWAPTSADVIAGLEFET